MSKKEEIILCLNDQIDSAIISKKEYSDILKSSEWEDRHEDIKDL